SASSGVPLIGGTGIKRGQAARFIESTTSLGSSPSSDMPLGRRQMTLERSSEWVASVLGALPTTSCPVHADKHHNLHDEVLRGAPARSSRLDSCRLLTRRGCGRRRRYDPALRGQARSECLLARSQ